MKVLHVRWQNQISVLFSPPLFQLCARSELIPFTSFLSMPLDEPTCGTSFNFAEKEIPIWRQIFSMVLSGFFKSVSNCTCITLLSFTFSPARMEAFQSLL